MAWLTEALGGPVLAWEIKRATRRTLWRVLPIGYCAWLVVQTAALFSAVIFTSAKPPIEPLSRLEMLGAMHAQQIELLDDYLKLLLLFQLVLVIGMVPAFTASCLGQEKERGTLFALFGTQLTSRQILLGKLLGRLLPIMPIALTTLPALVFIATYTNRGLLLLIPALVQQATFAIAMGAVGLLFGIWIRRAADAVIASYLFLALAYVTIRWLAASLPVMFWFDPVENLSKLLAGGSWATFATHLAVWALVGVLCLRLGWGRLRKVCVEQRDRRPPRRLWAFRPAVGNDPIRWRECHVIGLAPLPILRIVPRWLAVLAVFTISTAVVGMFAEIEAPGFSTALTWALVRVQIREAFEILHARGNAMGEVVVLMGLVFILLGNLLVGVRCGTSVAEEKRRNTWDDLLLTAQSFREITTSKMWGVLQGTVPYIVAYTLPVFFLALVAGPGALVFFGMWIVVPCAIVLCAALMGIDMVKVPPDMDETRPDGAFWFENERAKRRRYQTRRQDLW